MQRAEFEAFLGMGAEQMGLAITSEMRRQFWDYALLLSESNEETNLTAITGLREIVTKHFLDCLGLLRAPGWANMCTVADVGSGAGFPGIPLKIVRPGLRVSLIESRSRKATFLRRAIDELGLEGIDVLEGRAEDLGRGDYRESFDVAVARAVAALPVLLELMLPLVRVGGTVIAAKGPGWQEEAEEGRGVAPLLGGETPRGYPLSIPFLEAGRWAVVVPKVEATDPRYPRRAGVPAKRPLRPKTGNL